MRARLGGKQLAIGFVALLASVAFSGFAGGAAQTEASGAASLAARVAIVWTGTDAQRHLNFAAIDV